MPFDLTLAQLAAFLLAALLITLAPGPDNLSVLSLGIARGRRAGIGFGTGCALGCLTHTLWVSLGVSAALAASPTAFAALRMAGAAYLCWLGWQALRAGGKETRIDAATAAGADTTPLAVHLRRGFIANAINPKVALFFLAFLPQFVATGSPHATAQSVALGTLFAVQTMLVFGLIGWFAGHIGGWLRRSEGADKLMNRATGLLFIGLGLRLATETH